MQLAYAYWSNSWAYHSVSVKQCCYSVSELWDHTTLLPWECSPAADSWSPHLSRSFHEVSFWSAKVHYKWKVYINMNQLDAISVQNWKMPYLYFVPISSLYILLKLVLEFFDLGVLCLELLSHTLASLRESTYDLGESRLWSLRLRSRLSWLFS